MCDPCRGGAGRERAPQKKPAAARTWSPPRPDAKLALLERIAVALERLSSHPGHSNGPQEVGQIGLSSSAASAASEPVVPASLRPFLDSALAAGPGAQASDILEALGFGVGSPGRGFAFAALGGVLAVARPQLRLGGLFYGTRSHDAARASKFLQEHSTLCFIKTFSDVSLPTVVHSVARVLRQHPEERLRHGGRFLADVGQLSERLL